MMSKLLLRRSLAAGIRVQPFRCASCSTFWRRRSSSAATDRSSYRAPPSQGPTHESDGDGATKTTTHFGFQQVRWEEKESKVRQVFDSVADSYDVMNDLMSGGLHRLWKDHVATTSNVREMAQFVRRRRQQQEEEQEADQELRILDVAGGTGDLSFRFVDAAECWVSRAELQRKQSGNETTLHS
jgi:ubiE/COQ5 methyltransferase family